MKLNTSVKAREKKQMPVNTAVVIIAAILIIIAAVALAIKFYNGRAGGDDKHPPAPPPPECHGSQIGRFASEGEFYSITSTGGSIGRTTAGDYVVNGQVKESGYGDAKSLSYFSFTYAHGHPFYGSNGEGSLTGNSWSEHARGFAPSLQKCGPASAPDKVLVIEQGDKMCLDTDAEFEGLVIRQGGQVLVAGNATLKVQFLLIESGGLFQAGSTYNDKFRFDGQLTILLTNPDGGYAAMRCPASQYSYQVYAPGVTTDFLPNTQNPTFAPYTGMTTIWNNTYGPKSVCVGFNGNYHLAGALGPKMPYTGTWNAKNVDTGEDLFESSDWLSIGSSEDSPPFLPSSYAVCWAPLEPGQYPANSNTVKVKVSDPSAIKWWQGKEIVLLACPRQYTTEKPVVNPTGLLPIWVNNRDKAQQDANSAATATFLKSWPPAASINGPDDGVPGVEVQRVQSVGSDGTLTLESPLKFDHSTGPKRLTRSQKGANPKRIDVECPVHVGVLTRNILITSDLKAGGLGCNVLFNKDSLTSMLPGRAGHSMAQTMLQSGMPKRAAALQALAQAAPVSPQGPGGSVVCNTDGDHMDPSKPIWQTCYKDLPYDQSIYCGDERPVDAANVEGHWLWGTAGMKGCNAIHGGQQMFRYGSGVCMDGVEMKHMGTGGNFGKRHISSWVRKRLSLVRGLLSRSGTVHVYGGRQTKVTRVRVVQLIVMTSSGIMLLEAIATAPQSYAFDGFAVSLPAKETGEPIEDDYEVIDVPADTALFASKLPSLAQSKWKCCGPPFTDAANTPVQIFLDVLHKLYSFSTDQLVRCSSKASHNQQLSDALSHEVLLRRWAPSTAMRHVARVKDILALLPLPEGFLESLRVRTKLMTEADKNMNPVLGKYGRLPLSSPTRARLEAWLEKLREKTRNKSKMSQESVMRFYYSACLPALGLDLESWPDDADSHLRMVFNENPDIVKQIIGNGGDTAVRKLHKLEFLFSELLNVSWVEYPSVQSLRRKSTVENSDDDDDDDGHDVHRISTEDLERLYEEARKNTRSELYFLLMLTTGLRVGGVCRILTKNVASIENGEYVIRNCGKTREKGNKMGHFSMCPLLQEVMKEWLTKKRPADSGPYLFPGYKVNSHLTPATIRADFRQLCKDCGLEGREFHPHALRHTNAHILLECGNSVEAISKCLNHSTPNVTQQFYLKESPEEVIQRCNVPWMEKDKAKQRKRAATDTTSRVVPTFLIANQQATTNRADASTSIPKRSRNNSLLAEFNAVMRAQEGSAISS